MQPEKATTETGQGKENPNLRVATGSSDLSEIAKNQLMEANGIAGLSYYSVACYDL